MLAKATDAAPAPRSDVSWCFTVPRLTKASPLLLVSSAADFDAAEDQCSNCSSVTENGTCIVVY